MDAQASAYRALRKHIDQVRPVGGAGVHVRIQVAQGDRVRRQDLRTEFGFEGLLESLDPEHPALPGARHCNPDMPLELGYEHADHGIA